MKNNIQGTGVALVTPFDASGKIDFEALGRLVRYVSDGGVDYLVALGTTAETPTLSQDEKREVLECIKANNVKTLPLVLGIGGNSTAETAQAFSRYDMNGVDAILSVTPYYNKPSQAGLFDHYRCLAIEAPRPIILYNVPSRTGVNMTAETSLKLAREVRNIMGIKEACGSINQMAHLLKGRPEGFRVISGDDGMALALGAMGGDGVISVAANAFPAQVAQMVRAIASGDVTSAAALNMQMLEVIDALFEEGNPVGIKTALTVKGLIHNSVRLPLVSGSDKLLNKIDALIKESGL